MFDLMRRQSVQTLNGREPFALMRLWCGAL